MAWRNVTFQARSLRQPLGLRGTMLWDGFGGDVQGEVWEDRARPAKAEPVGPLSARRSGGRAGPPWLG